MALKADVTRPVLKYFKSSFKNETGKVTYVLHF